MSQLDHVWQEPRPETGNPASMDTVAPPKGPARPRRAYVQLAVLGVAVAVAATAVAWLALRGTSDATPVPAPNSGPVLVSQAQLESLAGSLDHPIYWAGPRTRATPTS